MAPPSTLFLREFRRKNENILLTEDMREYSYEEGRSRRVASGEIAVVERIHRTVIDNLSMMTK